jgi:hypothetical protein
MCLRHRPRLFSEISFCHPRPAARQVKTRPPVPDGREETRAESRDLKAGTFGEMEHFDSLRSRRAPGMKRQRVQRLSSPGLIIFYSCADEDAGCCAPRASSFSHCS